jgi:metal-responsive CopG/Arc/MetJ family transcriptional regulator
MKNGRKRLSLFVPQTTLERLDRLKDRTDAPSRVEVIRQALYVYEQLADRLCTGSKLMEKTDEGELFPLHVFIDIKQPVQ